MKKLLLLPIFLLISCTTETTNNIDTTKYAPPINQMPPIYCGVCKGVGTIFNSSTNYFEGWQYMIELNPPVSGNNRLRFIIPYTGTATIYSSPPAYNIGDNICSTGGVNYEYLYFP